jgi:DNA processing protein
MEGEGSATNTELVCAVAVGESKPALRYELTKLAREAGSFSCAEGYLSNKSLVNAQKSIVVSLDLGLEIWPLTSKLYPALLREIDAPPAALFVRRESKPGDIPVKSISVVGRRAASLDVCQEATRLSARLASAGLTIISGLALGIDAAAHRGALQTSLECPTVAVLAHGLDMIYPPTHLRLSSQILKAGGILVSEYAPTVGARRHHFLARNRIIAGLSQGIVLVEAGLRSGSLVTAKFAADFGRDVFVLRGNSTDGDCADNYAGGEDLIAQGATPITSVVQILSEYGLEGIAVQEEMKAQWTTQSLDSFQEQRGYSMTEVLKLELAGEIEVLPGNRVRCRA